MAFNWKINKLSDAAEIKYGKDHKKLSDGNIPVYGTGGIMRYGNRSLYDQESILIPRKGSLGNMYFVNEPFWTVDTLFWTIINVEVAFPRFLFYKLKTFDFISMDVGSAIPSLTTSLLNKIELSLPPLPEQRAIASILSNIDDKIENNLSMNQTLEEMAMALYKHWFVDFGPFQDGEFVESELGMIPEGWEVNDLRSVINLNPRLSIKKGVTASFVEMKALPVDVMSVSVIAKKEFKSGTKFQNGDTLFARITPCLENGKTAFVDFLEPNEIGFGSTEFLILRAQEGYSNYWNYCLSRTDDFRAHAISCMVGTSGRQRVQNDPVMNFKFPLAPKKVYQMFENNVEPLFKKVRQNIIENQTLKAQRDALSPKLVSGEVRVKGFE